MLRIFVEVLAKPLESERAAIDVRMNGIDGKLTVHKNRWRERILRKPSKLPGDPDALIVIPPF
jgi:hypothetical protein